MKKSILPFVLGLVLILGMSQVYGGLSGYDSGFGSYNAYRSDGFVQYCYYKIDPVCSTSIKDVNQFDRDLKMFRNRFEIFKSNFRQYDNVGEFDDDIERFDYSLRWVSDQMEMQRTYLY